MGNHQQFCLFLHKRKTSIQIIKHKNFFHLKLNSQLVATYHKIFCDYSPKKPLNLSKLVHMLLHLCEN